MNRAWGSFARANGATWKEADWGIGTLITDAIPEVLRPFYTRLFGNALAGRAVVEHDYECSSPTTFRSFRMRILPCDLDELVVVHSLLRETPHSTPACPALESIYRRRDGLIRQCCHCRRCERADDTGAWDSVPAYVERSAPDTSHGLCRLCADYYYTDSADLDR